MITTPKSTTAHGRTAEDAIEAEHVRTHKELGDDCPCHTWHGRTA